MIYLVSGFPRSGTSMMMAALEAGGLPVVCNPLRNTALHRADGGGYSVNPGDVYESTARERQLPEWPREHDGKALKVVSQWVGDLAVHEYRVVVMRRHSEEIRQSFEGAFRRRITAEAVERVVNESLKQLLNRRDVMSIHELWFDDVLADPRGWLATLPFPIDVTTAASVVDPKLKRFRIDSLVVGA